MSAISEGAPLHDIYLSPDGGPLGKAVVPELSPREQLLEAHADNIRLSFRDFAEMLTRCRIPFPSGHYRLGEEGFIYDDICNPEPGHNAKKAGVGLSDRDKTDREIHAFLVGRTNLVPAPQKTYMIMWTSSGSFETASATYVPDIDDEHGEWKFDKGSREPATDEQVLMHSLPLSHKLFSRLEYELEAASRKGDRASVERYQTALRVRESLEKGIVHEIISLVKAT